MLKKVPQNALVIRQLRSKILCVGLPGNILVEASRQCVCTNADGTAENVWRSACSKADRSLGFGDQIILDTTRYRMELGTHLEDCSVRHLECEFDFLACSRNEWNTRMPGLPAGSCGHFPILL